MKFSERKKAKMRKYRQRRIRRTYNSMRYGCSGWYDNNFQRWESLDYAKFKNDFYILAENDKSSGFAIFKMVSDKENVRLSSKRLAYLRDDFKNPNVWDENSQVVISSKGVIKKVNVGAYKKPTTYSGRLIIFPIY